MDKYEYKIRSEEIKTLIAAGEYAEAAAIADTIDWSRVKSVMMLCTISDLYKVNRRLEESRDLLLLAYERHPGGRSIVYSLCELSIKMGEFVQAVEYYKEFVQVAPKDSGRYVLQYKLYEAQDVSLEERIAVLEELKARDYTEKWAYELAYLYHRVGLGTRCVEECDELILWFGEGKYVWKAMELKMLHENLTPEQQARYDNAKGVDRKLPRATANGQNAYASNQLDLAPTVEIPSQDLDIQVKVMNVGQYDTINMQRELAKNMKELWEGTEAGNEAGTDSTETRDNPSEEAITKVWDEGVFAGTQASQDAQSLMLDETGELYALEGEPAEVDSKEQVSETKIEEVFFGETAEMDTTAAQVMESLRNEKQEATNETVQMRIEPGQDSVLELREETPGDEARSSQFEKMLGMEYDGQISLLIPESEQIEKQITGQLKLEDILSEWERMKRDSDQKRMEAVRQRVLEQTGSMFTEFEVAIRDGLLEQLEKGTSTGIENIPEDMGEVEELPEIEELSEDEEQPEIEETTEQGETEEESDDEDLADRLVEEEVLTEDTLDGESEDEEQIEEVEDVEGSEAEEDVQEELDEKDAVEASEEPEEVKAESGSESVKPKAAKVRTLSQEEKELFASYIHCPQTKDQIIYALDHMSMASYAGNVVLTGEEGMDILTLAKNLVKEMQTTDRNFSGKIAKISAKSLNKRDITQTLEKLSGGALVIQEAGSLSDESADRLHKELNHENRGIMILLTDTKKAIHKWMDRNASLVDCFNICIDVEALDDDSLVEYGKKYAKEQEYSIDEMGVLALHTRISDMQTSDHAVTVAEVKSIVDEAIRRANRKNLSHFFDILVAKRYDEEDMIILREKDFA